MPAFFAFLHHAAAFTLVAALAAEFLLLADELTVRNARRLLAVDAAYGASAGLLLVIGLLRVAYFEKGAAYYLHSAPFVAKLALFAAAALLSVAPTLEFLSWRKDLRAGRVPVLDERRRRRLRAILHVELAAVALILLCAALMAKGVGYFG